MFDKFCKQLVSGPGWWSRSTCSRKAKKDGYCKQHHPDTIKARRIAANEKYQAGITQEKEYIEQKEAAVERKIQERIDAAVEEALLAERNKDV